MKVKISPEQRFLRKSLKTLDELLSRKYGCLLFDVLSALRGPDSDNNDVKKAATGLIRGKAFPRVLSKSDDNDLGLVVTHEDNEDLVNVRRDLENNREESRHFLNHAHLAFKHLGLSWYTVNIPTNQHKKVKK